LAETKDSGLTWAFKPLPALSGRDRAYTILAFDSFDNNTFYCVGSAHAISGILSFGVLFRSIDAGETWVDVFSAELSITAFVPDPSNRGTLYVGSFGSGAQKSSDGGSSWASFLSYPWVGGIAIDPSNASIVYVGTGGEGILKNGIPANNGIDYSSYPAATPVIAPSKPAELFANTPIGVYRSDDAAASWHFLLTDGQILAVDPRNADTLYLRRGSRLLKSTDGGSHCADITAGLIADTIGGFLADTSDPKLVFAGGTGEVFAMHESGLTWNRTSEGLPANDPVRGLANDPSSPNVFYAALFGHGVFKSQDRGLTWLAANTGITDAYATSVAADSGLTGVVYLASTQALFRSDDGGGNWRRLTQAPPADSVIADPKRAGVLYAAWYGGVFQSTDRGETWLQLGDFSGVRGLAIDPSDSRKLYAATDSGLYVSRDGGATWFTPTAGLPRTALSAVTIDPGRTSRIYVDNGTSMVFQSADGGSSWVAISPLPINGSIAGVAKDGMVYAKPPGKSLFVYEPIPDRPQALRIPGTPRPKKVDPR